MSFAIDKEHVETLKRSMEIVGQLQPVLVEKGTEGKKVLVGRHKIIANPKCRTEEIEVKDDLHREQIIIHGNVQRGIPEEEAKLRVERVAQILVSRGIEKKKVCQEIVNQKLLPWGERHVERLLSKEYKMETGSKNRHVSVSNVISEAQEHVKNVKTALADLGTRTDEEPRYPFPNCQCRVCSNRFECY